MPSHRSRTARSFAFPSPPSPPSPRNASASTLLAKPHHHHGTTEISCTQDIPGGGPAAATSYVCGSCVRVLSLAARGGRTLQVTHPGHSTWGPPTVTGSRITFVVASSSSFQSLWPAGYGPSRSRIPATLPGPAGSHKTFFSTVCSLRPVLCSPRSTDPRGHASRPLYLGSARRQPAPYVDRDTCLLQKYCPRCSSHETHASQATLGKAVLTRRRATGVAVQETKQKRLLRHRSAVSFFYPPFSQNVFGQPQLALFLSASGVRIRGAGFVFTPHARLTRRRQHA